MADPVEIIFQVGGIADVQTAFQKLDAILARFEGTRRNSGERGVREAKGQAARTVDAHVKEWEKWPRKQAAILKRAAEQAEKDAKRAAARAGTDAEKAAKAEERAAVRLSTAKKRERDKEVAAGDRAFRRLEALVEREGKAEERIAKRVADRKIAEDKRATDKRIAARGKLDAALGAGAGAIGRSVSGVGRAAINLGAGALALGGGFSLADVVGRATSAERAAIALSNSANLPGQTRTPTADILRRASEVQGQTGVDKQDLIKGMASYVGKTSDIGGAMANLGEMAMLAKGGGVDFTELMTAAGSIKTQNAKISPEDLSSMMRNIVGQGKLGAVEISDLATVAGKITATSGMYAGSQTETQRKLLGLAQVAIKATASPEEAGTAIARLGGDTLKSKNADLKSLGLVDAKTGNIAPVEDILSKVLGKTEGNLGKIQNMGFGLESIKLFEALQPIFREAEAKQKGTGAAAVKAEVTKYGAAEYTKANVAEDVAAVSAGKGERIDRAMQRVREAIEGKLLPHLNKFVDRLPELLPKIERIIDGLAGIGNYLIENPIKGAGALMLAAVSRDLAAAGIGAGVKAMITSMLTGATGGAPTAITGPLAATLGPGASAANARVGQGMAVAGALALGITVGTVLIEATNATITAASREQAASAGLVTGAGGVEATPEAIAAAKVKKEALTEDIKKQQGASMTREDIGDWLFSALARIPGTGGADFDDVQKRTKEAELGSINASKDALVRLTAAIEKAEAALGGVKPPIANPDAPNRGVPQAVRTGGAG